ncbi:tRNA 2-selenouridine(34) synthase MnmH [Gilvimarinus sp. F26214L]|uniref:tRNA 2-selenouridine(34) synthase MnmH n=1 Tax=Gilvimarinus sp. DZF01 TaxID=3461371 RepID=UPI0040461D31
MDCPDTANYRALFLEDVPMIDTRAPVEFAKGAFPTAVNLPLMTDDERARVGTCYKEHGQAAAIDLGHQLVHGAVKEARVQAWRDFAEHNPQGYLYCFRGGLRSRICQDWLREAGCDYPRVLGGYKAMRRFLIDTLERISQQGQFVILAGRTGAAKTELLRQVPNSVDLEELARHRGSAFGRRVGGQPSQINFENALAIQLLRTEHAWPGAPIVLEDESGYIGSNTIPEALRTAMATAPLIVVDADLESRVDHSFTNYILHNLTDWRQTLGEEAGFRRFASELRESLGRLQKRLGGQRYGEVSEILETAIRAHASGDSSLHREWIRILLRDYYDPMYDYQLSRKRERVAFRGGPAAVRARLLEAVPG